MDDLSDPDIYLSNENPEVSLKEYTWRSAQIGTDIIEVNSLDTKFKY